MELSINKAQIQFESDRSVGIEMEEYSMELPMCSYDANELEELFQYIQEIYIEYCETRIVVYFENTETDQLWFSNGEEIKNDSELYF